MRKSLAVGFVALIVGGLGGYACSQNGGGFGGGVAPGPVAPPQPAFPQAPNGFVVQAQPVQKQAATQTRIWATPGGVANDAISKKLDQPLTEAGFDFNDTPLEEVVEFLSDEYKIAIQIDVAALDDLGIAPDEPVSVSYRGIKLGSALRLMLQQLELASLPVDGVLLITSQEDAETRLSVAMYPVGDLDTRLLRKGPHLQPHAGGPFGHAKSKESSPIEEAIIRCVATNTWSANGGGEAGAHLLPNGVLVVSQTAAAHDEVLAFLNALRKASPQQAQVVPRPIVAPTQPANAFGAPWQSQPNNGFPVQQPGLAPQFASPQQILANPPGRGRGSRRPVSGPDGGSFDFGGELREPTPARPAQP